MQLLTIFLFFLYGWGIGYLVTFFAPSSKDGVERFVMRLGIGLGMIPILGILLHFIGIPLDWKIFLLLSLAGAGAWFYRNRTNLAVPAFRLKKSHIFVGIAVVLALFSFHMYTKGAFSYPYLEDDDSWAHAYAAKYISVEKNLKEPLPGQELIAYIDPYPPGYPILMGVLHQTEDQLDWVLKFFNALIISLGLVFFYYFAFSLMGNRGMALFSTFVLFAIPSYLSHFIWAHSFFGTLLFPAFYVFLRAEKDARWLPAGILITASSLLIAPDESVKFGILFGLFFVARGFSNRRAVKNLFITGAAGLGLSLVWWGNKAASLFGSHSDVATAAKGGAFAANIGTASRAYTFNDFYVATSDNMINNPIGIGKVLLLLTVVSVIIAFLTLKSGKKKWTGVALLWLGFTFLGVNSVTFNLPVGLFAFRFWFLMAIPIALLCSVGAWFLMDLSRGIKYGRIAVLGLLVFGILSTSFEAKYGVNTIPWRPGGLWSSPEEVQGYLQLKDLPPTRILAPCPEAQKKVVGMNHFYCAWCADENAFRSTFLTLSGAEVQSFMRAHDYRYIAIDGMCAQRLGENETSNFVNTLGGSGLFAPAVQTQGLLVLQTS